MALLLGALFVLGLVCGEQAHAAESTRALEKSADAVQQSADGAQRSADAVQRSVDPGQPVGPSVGTVTGGAIDVGEAAARAVQSPVGQAHKVVRPVAESAAKAANAAVDGVVENGAVDGVVENGAVDGVVDEQTGKQVGESAVRPVGPLVEGVTGALPEMPPPADSEWPELPRLPGLRGLPSLPGGTPLGGDGVQQPQAGTGNRPGGEAAVEDDARKSSDAAYGSAYGPHAQVAGPAGHLTDLQDDAAAHPVHVPARTPGGQPTGALVNQSLFDPGSPRHGDLHAASFAEGAPFRLMPGGTAATSAAGVRDRHRDINEFPG
ncbi:hypothetical protein H1V43_08815 [Streptomyces sp. PSKA54]|uniref:ATP-binding protein n=1 Tax=Streptomyces himalayensis subsp. aureolus TaxID=2758039 RepID=A0A7W2CYK8_9ACTN|nr:hypothetical protein [Streptomyces himalayensis]MBA4861488.1 hypothetical protein [Streptomyces himalayensis subsp. aureolus]